MLLEGYNVLDEKFTWQPLNLEYDTAILSMSGSTYQGACKGYIIPGLVDIHTHGAVAQDSMCMQDYDNYVYYMYSKGITTFYPTSVSATPKDMKKMAAYFGQKKEIEGINIEGPYIHKDFRGAHDESCICEGDIGLLYELQTLAENKIKLITVAPEVGQNMEFIQKVLEMGITVSLGHTSCDYQTAAAAYQMGADHITHLFNAMKPLHHRNSGLVGAAFDKPFYTEIIADGIHVTAEVVRLAYHAMGKDRLILISDSMCATGLSDGAYKLGSLDVKVENGIAYTLDGALAGSTSSLWDMVKSAVRMGISMEDALYMATKTPAMSVNLQDVGVLKEGNRADFVILDDNFEIIQTVKNGETVFSVC